MNLTTEPPGMILESGRQELGLTITELWLRCQGIGGNLTPGSLESVLTGGIIPDPGEYDVIAQALNDGYTDLGQDHPVPYAEDIGLEGAER